jgi:transposase
MSKDNFIRNLLGITDTNITFPYPEDEILSFQRSRNVNAKILHAKLSYSPLFCENCGQPNEGYSIVKNGGKVSNILLNKMAEQKTYLRLWKQRFSCRRCLTSFIAKTGLVDTHCFISKNVKFAIARNLQEKCALKDISNRNETSSTTVMRVMKNFYQQFQVNLNYLPEVLLFDEFKSVKKVAGKMSFIYMDGKTREIVDIVPNRQLGALENYFNKFPLKVRQTVKWVVIDMYAPYKTLIQRVFPNAKIVLDRFHIVQHMTRALNQTRITIMNALKNGTLEEQKMYRRLKKNWKLILKNKDELDYTNYKWQTSFRKVLCETEMVDELLSYSKELSMHYGVYQKFLNGIKSKDIDETIEVIYTKYPQLNKRFRTAFRTFKRFNESIYYAVEQPYSNGPLECMNNHIKVIKRNAYGYRSFENFKQRIMIVQRKLFPTI